MSTSAIVQDAPLPVLDRTGPPPPRPGQHMPWLDGVRGVAVLVVLIHNFTYFRSMTGSSVGTNLFRVVTASGWIGVQLFFVLSGFLITGILVDTRRAPNYFSSFYVRRVLRIFPLYYATLFLGFVVLPHIAELPGFAGQRQHQIWFWLYLSNWSEPFGRTVTAFSHFWSLAVEEQFYLLWPLVVFRLEDHRLLRLCLGLVGAALLFRVAALLTGQNPLLPYMATLARVDALAFGAAAAVLVRRPELSPSVLRLPEPPFLLGGLGVLLVSLAVRGFWWEDPLITTLGQTFLVLLCGGLIFVGAGSPRFGGAVRGVLSRPSLRFFGKYSYAMYVLPYPVGKALTPWFERLLAGCSEARQLLWVGAFCAAHLALAVVLSQLSWHLLEKPALGLKQRFSARAPA